MKLYYSEGSPYARKVRIVLAEKGLDFEGDQSHTGMSVEEHAAINPNLQVPIFEDGDLRLFESNLILEYLLKRLNTRAVRMPSRRVLCW